MVQAITLKPGDKVKYTGPNGSGFTRGFVYKVGGFYHAKGYGKDAIKTVGVVYDDNGKANGYKEEYFRKVNSGKSVDEEHQEKFNWLNTLKPGDKVVFDPPESVAKYIAHSGHLTPGKTYVVGGRSGPPNFNSVHDSLGIEADNYGKENGHRGVYFRKTSINTLKSFIGKLGI